MKGMWSADRLSGAAHGAWQWAEANVLVWQTVFQAAAAVVALVLVWVVARRLTGLTEGAARRLPAGPLQRIGAGLSGIAPWLLLLILVWFAEMAFASAQQPHGLLRLVESLALAWVLIRLSSRLVHDVRLARLVAVLAWIIAALNIAGLIAPTEGLLNSMAFSIGALRLSVLLLLKAVVLLVVLIWLANTLARITEQRLEHLPNLTPAMQVLAGKLVRITLLVLAVVIALGAVGIDLTAFAVFSGAVGVGIGFGLQKVVSNLISGVILLLDRSIKPGDVIEVEGTYGWITKMNARFVSVVTRDGTEFLIPNEDLITQRVINWSYTDDLVRLHVPFGIAYGADLHLAMRLALDAAASVPRVVKEPPPRCLLHDFGDNSVDLELRLWISDPRNGIASVKSDVLLEIWDRFRAHGIELPFPQRDLWLRNPEVLASALAKTGRSAVTSGGMAG